MAIWCKRLASVLALTSLLLVSGAAAIPVSAAEEAVLLPGATPFKQINPFYPMIARTYPEYRHQLSRR